MTTVHVDDGRYPYSAVCEVFATFSDGFVGQGSGVLVSANDVLTASHVLWQTDHGGAATSVTVYPGENGSFPPYGAQQAKHWYYYQIGDSGNSEKAQAAQYDVGIVSLGTRVGDHTGWFGMDPITPLEPMDLHLTGYPIKYGPDN